MIVFIQTQRHQKETLTISKNMQNGFFSLQSYFLLFGNVLKKYTHIFKHGKKCKTLDVESDQKDKVDRNRRPCNTGLEKG